MTARNSPLAIWWRGRWWAVSPDFWDRTVAVFPELEEIEWDACMVEIMRLLTLSERRRLDDDQRARLSAYVRHWNLRSNIDFAAGRDLGVFGFDYHDQLHGWRGSFDCGCELHAIFDDFVAARAADDADGAAIHLHPHYPRHVCARHRSLAHDLEVLHATVLADAGTGVDGGDEILAAGRDQ